MGAIYFILFLSLCVWAGIIFLSFKKLRPELKKVVGKGIIIVYAIFLLIVIIGRICWTDFFSEFQMIALSYDVSNYFNEIISVATVVNTIIDFFILVGIGGIVWGVFISKAGENVLSGKTVQTKINLNKATEYIEGAKSIVKQNQNKYINKNLPMNEYPFVTGKDIGDKINKIYDLLKIEAITEDEAKERKRDTIDSIINSRIPEDSDAFAIEVNKNVEDGRIDSGEVKEILNSCTMKNTMKKLEDKEIINILSSKEDIEKIRVQALRFELLTRGYAKEAIEDIQLMKNKSEIELFNEYEKVNFEYLSFKLESLNINASELVKIKRLLNLESKEAVDRYLLDRMALEEEYEQAKKENTVGKIAQKTAVDAKKSGVELFTKGLDFYKKKKMICNSVIGVVCVIIVVIIGAEVYMDSPPSNSTVKKYIMEQIGPEGSNVKIIKTNKHGINNDIYTVDYDYIVNSNGYKTRYTQDLDYDYINKTWIPQNVYNQVTNEIPTSGLTQTQITNQLNGVNVKNVKLNSAGINVMKINNDFENSKLSAQIIYSAQGQAYSVNLKGDAIFAFNNGNWVYQGFDNVNKDLKISGISKDQMKNLMNTSPNSPTNGQASNGTTFTIQNDNINNKEGVATATIVATTVDNNDCLTQVATYNVTFTFEMSENNYSGSDYNGPGWYLTSANQKGNSSVTPLAPTTNLVNNLLGGFGNTISNISYQKGSNTATVNYNDGSNETATLNFTNNQWQLAGNNGI